jgi:hypothetical protein
MGVAKGRKLLEGREVMEVGNWKKGNYLLGNCSKGGIAER